MQWFRQTLRNNRVVFLTVLATTIFYLVEGARFVEARQIRLQEEERHLEELSAVFGIPMEKLRSDDESVFRPIKKLVVDGVGSAVEAGFGRLQKIVRQRKDRAVPPLSHAQERVGELIRSAKRSLSSGPQVQIAAAFPQERPSPIQTSGRSV
ncbi:MAG: hypothetical protein GY854_19425 [Deltaproteobacteria bacterium]|nr:hypothetical protein [Deltaproteobacteria bacterium]